MWGPQPARQVLRAFRREEVGYGPAVPEALMVGEVVLERERAAEQIWGWRQYVEGSAKGRRDEVVVVGASGGIELLQKTDLTEEQRPVCIDDLGSYLRPVQT